jgi:hypothetical protein
MEADILGIAVVFACRPERLPRQDLPDKRIVRRFHNGHVGLPVALAKPQADEQMIDIGQQATVSREHASQRRRQIYV